jgi:hypothetical protein
LRRLSTDFLRSSRLPHTAGFELPQPLAARTVQSRTIATAGRRAGPLYMRRDSRWRAHLASPSPGGYAALRLAHA